MKNSSWWELFEKSLDTVINLVLASDHSTLDALQEARRELTDYQRQLTVHLAYLKHLRFRLLSDKDAAAAQQLFGQVEALQQRGDEAGKAALLATHRLLLARVTGNQQLQQAMSRQIEDLEVCRRRTADRLQHINESIPALTFAANQAWLATHQRRQEQLLDPQRIVRLLQEVKDEFLHLKDVAEANAELERMTAAHGLDLPALGEKAPDELDAVLARLQQLLALNRD